MTNETLLSAILGAALVIPHPTLLEAGPRVRTQQRRLTMGANEKAPATFHPSHSHPYICEWCTQVWTNPISAALCCDEASNAIPTID